MQFNEGTLLLLVLLLVVALAVWVLVARSRRARSEALRDQFGPEYDRALRAHSDRTGAERDLLTRERRMRSVQIRSLSAGDRDRFTAAWTETQRQFVDDPRSAVASADRLITEVMVTRGYPMADFEHRAGDLSVDHPQVVEDYRSAHSLAGTSERGTASTEDLRQAFVHYRSLFADLLAPADEEERRPGFFPPTRREAH